MVVGRLDNLRIGAVIQARMKSERLPGKVLAPLPFPDGKPMLWWVVNSLKQSKLVTDVILATSKNKENDALEDYSKEIELQFLRGSENDVVSRFVQGAREYNLDVVIRLTGDNPVVDVHFLDELIERHISNKNDYTRSCGLPLGMNFEIISAEALIKIDEMDLSDSDREHVTLYFRNNNCKKEEVVFFGDEDLKQTRLTVDYPSDLAMMSLIFATLDKGSFPNIETVQKLKQLSPWIFEVNAINKQRDPKS